MPVRHYENFPVASWLLPARLRPPIEAIYAFARGADDIADEGEIPDAGRLEGLDRYARALDAIERGEKPAQAPFARLAGAVAEYELPIALLRDLLEAFRQDVTRKRYDDFPQVLDYCRRSANPVGRLLLHLFRKDDAAALACSDSVCTALQLINFWQDVALDWRKGRVYIPQEDLARFGVTERAIAEGRADEKWAGLMAFECGRARSLLDRGRPLGAVLPGRIGLEIRATIGGGAAILDKIEAVKGDVFGRRPQLAPLDWIALLTRALIPARRPNR